MFCYNKNGKFIVISKDSNLKQKTKKAEGNKLF